MDWLVPAILASMTGSIVVASVFAYLAHTERERCLQLWAAGWVLYTVRLVLDLGVALLPDGATLLGLLAAAMGIAYAMLMLAGTASFLGRPPRVRLLGISGLAALAVTVAAQMLGLTATLVAIPAYLIQGIARIATGYAWWRYRDRGGRWASIAAVGFLLWGLHALDYPLLRGVPDAAAAGFMVAAALALSVALCVLVAYFERTKRLLSDSEARYRTLFENSASVMLVIDPVTAEVVDANRSAEEFYGWSRDQLTGMHLSDINTLGPDEIAREMALARERGRYYFLFKHRLASGDIRDVEVFSGPVITPDRELLYSIVHDVTERMTAERRLAESEARYRTLFHSSEQPMLLVEPKGARIIEANVAAATFYGYPVEKLVTMAVVDLTDDSDDVIADEIDATVSGHRQCGSYWHRRADGEHRAVEVYSTPLEFGDRTLIYTIIHDVTTRADAEHALQEQQKNLESLVAAQTADLREAMAHLETATRAKDEFLASMSHELRTPLNSVIGFAHLLGEELPGPLNEEQHRQIAMVERSGRHLLVLVNQVLDLSRIEAGQVEVESTRVDAVDIASYVIESMQGAAEERDLALVLDVGRDVVATTDPHLVEQILWNLVGNALKYTTEGEVRLSVTRDGEQVRFEVRDTGPGLSADQLSRAFDRFSRFHAHEEAGGTGLGLNISMRLAECLGGRIEAASELGVGSTFTFILPDQVPPDAAGS